MSNSIIIVVGSGRSGTSFMVWILRWVYGIGTSAEPKNVLKLCKYLEKLDLKTKEGYRHALETCYNANVLNHLREKGWNTAKEELGKHIQAATVEGFVLGLFKYVAELRSRPLKITVDFPGYKDPKDLLNMAELRRYLPNSWFINMVRKGEDVAYSKLNQYWGATNPVAGAFYWRRQMKTGMHNKEKINGEKYLELRLEDLYDDFDNYCYKLDAFMHKATGRSSISCLQSKLKEYAKSRTSYVSNNLMGNLIAYLVGDVNEALGYQNVKVYKRRLSSDLLVFAYLLLDLPLRGINLAIKKLGGSMIRPLKIS